MRKDHRVNWFFFQRKRRLRQEEEENWKLFFLQGKKRKGEERKTRKLWGFSPASRFRLASNLIKSRSRSVSRTNLEKEFSRDAYEKCHIAHMNDWWILWCFNIFPNLFPSNLLFIAKTFQIFFSILGVANNPLGIDWKSKRWSRWLPNTKHETPMRKSAIKWCRFIGPQVFLRSKDEIRLPGKFVITHAMCKSCLSYCEEIRSGWFGDS